MQLAITTERQPTAKIRVGRARTAEDEAVFRAMIIAVGETGYAKLTFAALAKRVNLTPSALVQRFGSKRRLVLAFLEWFQATASGIIRPSLDRTPEAPLDAFRSALVTWVGQLPAEPSQIANLASFFPQLAGDPDMRAVLARFDALLERTIQGGLRSAVDKGQLKQLDSVRVSRVLIAAFRGTLMRWAVIPEGSLADRVLEFLNTVLAPYEVAKPGS